MDRNKLALAIKDVRYVYQQHHTEALKGISFDVQHGEFVSIIGHNGAGKTTLLKSLVGLLRPTAGRILVEGIDTRLTNTAELATRVGLVMQNPDQQLFAMTVEEEVAFGPRNLGLDQAEILRRLEAALEYTGLTANRKEYPPALPRGERARVVIASVLAMQPQIFVFDEPTTGQDYKGCHQIMQIARELQRTGRTVLVVTHDMSLVAEYSERTLVLCQGEILMDDTTACVFAQPGNLSQAHIRPPQITRLAQSLPSDLSLPDCALTVEELSRAVGERADRAQKQVDLADGKES